MKKYIKTLLVITVAAAIFATLALSASAATSGDFTYSVSNGEAKITDYTGSATELVIPETLGGYPVTSIGDDAFSGCSSLTSVTIPDSVTSIGEWAFFDCSSLSDVYISDVEAWLNVSDSSNFLMLYADNLYIIKDGEEVAELVIPDGVTTIRSLAFKNCTSLTSVTIPDSVTSIGEDAFWGCSSLERIDVQENNTEYSSADGILFNKDKTTLITYPAGKSQAEYKIPDSVTSIGNYAFGYCRSLTSMTIDDSVTSIGGWAFGYCSSLASITIPDSVTSIGGWAFYGCSGLASVTIPDSVTSIGWGAFEECSSLEEVHITDIGSWCEIDFGSSYANPLYYAENLLINGKLAVDIIVPKGTRKIGDYAFFGYGILESIDIPDSVTSIGGNAFRDCSNLANIMLPDSVTSIGGNVFYNTAYYNNSSNWEDDVLYIGKCLIGAKTSVSKVEIKAGTSCIGGDVFYNCSSLTSVTIPDSVTSIGDFAFEHCNNLASVTIPSSVTSIGINAFFGCDNLTIYCYAGSYAENYANDNDIPFVTISGNYILGDANGDEDVDFVDAILVLKHDADIEELTGDNLLAADVNVDSDVDFVDALLILKYDAGIITSFK